MIKSVVILAVLGLAAAQSTNGTDPCNQYSDCNTCNFVDGDTTKGNRKDCGWCMGGVSGGSSSKGGCASLKEQWRCKDSTWTFTCPKGWMCDQSSQQCKQSAAPGEGQLKSVCEASCKTDQKYRCNQTSYMCEPCKAGDMAGCSADKEEACAQCKKPPTKKPTKKPTSPPSKKPTPAPTKPPTKTPPKPTQPPSPKPTPAPTKHIPHAICDEKKMQCIPSNSSQAITNCQSRCSNSTPAELVGLYRGIHAEKGYKSGEYDYKFTEKTVEIKDATGKVTKGTVSTHPNGIWMKFDDKVIKAINPVSSNSAGPSTSSFAFAMGAAGADAPDTVTAAMDGSGSTLAILTKCKSWGAGGCDFSPVFADAIHRRLLAESPPEKDPCNAFTTCAQCAGVVVQGVDCGWCGRGTVIGLDGKDTGFKCGGKSGSKIYFSQCSSGYTTITCNGYGCDWGNANAETYSFLRTLGSKKVKAKPKCKLITDGSAKFKTEEECESSGECDTSMVKCNSTSKKCEPCKDGDTTGCNTKAFCEASCGIAKAKCNTETKQCEPCKDGDSSKDCVSKGECTTKCAQTSYGKCDHGTGTCKPCKKGTPDCTQGCSATCKKTPTKKPTPTPTKPPTKKPTKPPTPAVPTPAPTPTFSKCNTATHKCEICDHKADKDCIYTTDYCAAAETKICAPPPAPSANATYWRGIEVHTGFKRGEWDVQMNENKVIFSFTSGEGSATTKTWKATSTSSGEGGASGSVEFKFVTVPDSDDVLNMKAGDTLSGTVTTSPEQTNLGVQYMYMQLGSAANADKLTWVLVGCKKGGSGKCAFKPNSLGFEEEVEREAESVFEGVKKALRGSGKALNLY
jgi:hypothetical protein